MVNRTNSGTTGNAACLGLSVKQILQVLRRLRSMGPSQAIRAFRPTVIDSLLYALDTSCVRRTRLTDCKLQIKRYDVHTRSGFMEIDRRITRWRECYVAQVDGRTAHRSCLSFDTLLPVQFGFEREVPVIGDGVTMSEFRGRHIFPEVLRQIALDVTARNVAKRLYVLVSPQNGPSIRGIERAGFVRLSHLQGLRFAGILIRNMTRRSSPA